MTELISGVNREDDIIYDPSLQRGFPTSNRVTVVPKRNPKLVHFIENVSWNCVEHTLSMDITESSNFIVFDWLYNINVVRDALMKSAFGDLQREEIVLEFRNEDNQLLATATLSGLSLQNHLCEAGRDMLCVKNLVHSAVIKYEKLEFRHYYENPAKALKAQFCPELLEFCGGEQKNQEK